VIDPADQVAEHRLLDVFDRNPPIGGQAQTLLDPRISAEGDGDIDVMDEPPAIQNRKCRIPPIDKIPGPVS